MIKYTIIFCFLFLLNLYADKEIFLICNNTKSQMIDLEKNKISFFEKDNLITTIYVNKKLKKFYLGDDLRNNIELIIISNNEEIIQFLEPISSDHKVLLTYHLKSSILTTQKSYSLFGPIMVNIFQKCTKYN